MRVEELGYYMTAVSDWLSGSPVFGVLLTPVMNSKRLKKLWEEKRKEISKIYGVPEERFLWIRYRIQDGELELS